jgi:hypothetical protein
MQTHHKHESEQASIIAKRNFSECIHVPQNAAEKGFCIL